MTSTSDKHAKAVNKMQETNSFLVKLLTDKVFRLISSIHQFKEFAGDIIAGTDNAMAMVHAQRQNSDQKFEKLKGEVTIFRA